MTPIITGGNIMPPHPTAGAGLRQTVYAVEGVPTDANIGLPASAIVNGMLAQNVVSGFLYERAGGVWTRRDTV
jgi:hypothetical protein